MEIKDDLGLTGPLRLVTMTTAERDALTGLTSGEAYLLYNSDTAQVEVTYDGGTGWGVFGAPDYYRYSLYSTVDDGGASEGEHLEQHNVWDPTNGNVTVLHQTGVSPTIDGGTTGRPLTIPVTGIVSYRVYLTADDDSTNDNNFAEAKLQVSPDGSSFSNVCKGWLGGNSTLNSSCALEYLGPVTPTTHFRIEWDNPTGGSSDDIRVRESTLIIQQVA